MEPYQLAELSKLVAANEIPVYISTKWQWQFHDGHWHDFDAPTQQLFEASVASEDAVQGAASPDPSIKWTCEANDKEYDITFGKTMIQTRTNSKGEKVVQPIRRETLELPLEGQIRELPDRVF